MQVKKNVEKGSVIGCTIPPIRFVMGMNLIIKADESETRGPRIASGIRLPANRDYLTISTESHIQYSTGTGIYCILGTYEIQAQHVQVISH